MTYLSFCSFLKIPFLEIFLLRKQKKPKQSQDYLLAEGFFHHRAFSYQEENHLLSLPASFLLLQRSDLWIFLSFASDGF